MRTASYFLVFLIGLSTAATSQQKGPVYTPLPAANNQPSSKSSLPTSIVSSVPSSQINPQAEERESPAFRQQEPSLLAAKPDASPTQQYMVYYWANPNAKSSAYQSQQGLAGSSQTSVFSAGKWLDWVTGVGSVALVGVGTFMAYRNFASVKTRALRELQDMNAEDAARMAKGVMRALEKVYELSSSK